MHRSLLLSTLLGSAAVLTLSGMPAYAADSQDLKAEIAALRARLDQLEAKENATASVAATDRKSVV